MKTASCPSCRQQRIITGSTGRLRTHKWPWSDKGALVAVGARASHPNCEGSGKKAHHTKELP